ncbi:MAG: hypothetical protein AB1715_06080 [Acidobacteriota bacterium]
MEEEKLKDLMLRENADFKKLYLEHQAYEKKLEEFRSKAFLTEEEKLEEREIKKRKLALKDRMYLLMAEFRRAR